MPRIKIDLPDVNWTSFTIPVRITDINYGNHLANNALVAYVHEARVQWLKTGGFAEVAGNGLGLIMADLAVEYKSESFYADDLKFLVAAQIENKYGFAIYYKIMRAADVVAIAKTGMVYFNYNTKKVAHLPPDLVNFIEQGKAI